MVAERRSVNTIVPGRHFRHTYAQYAELERYSNVKHEFLDGEIYAMAGGTPDHASLAAQVLRALGNALDDQPRRVFTSDLRIFVEAPGLATYPDGSVICGEVQHHAPSPKDTALNPTVLLEVTSDSSESYDVGEKFEYYRTIPTLRDYIIVSHRERRITLYSRDIDGTWSKQVGLATGRVQVPSARTVLVVDDIYRKSSVQ